LETVKKNPYLSIVSPVYNGAECLPTFLKELSTVLEALKKEYEIILIHDRGTDDSWEVIKCLQLQYKKVVGINLSRNFGQHMAIRAGIDNANGEYVLIMDADLQHDPNDIPRFLEKAQNSSEIVIGITENRKHSAFKNMGASIFYFFINLLLPNKKERGARKELNFSLLSKKAVQAYRLIRHINQHHLMTLRWLGFSRDYIPVNQRKRELGTSSYNLIKLVRHALNGVVMYSDKLLYLSVNIGLFFFIFSILSSCYLIYKYFFFGSQPGWTSLAVLVLFATSLILFSIGVLGIYLGMAFNQVKGRPLYIIDEILILPEHD
jgi:polyisoprenyl-phosphate glycosyltransferase